MTTLRVFQILNVSLLIINGVVLFIPKTMHGVHTNAAGGLMLIALAMLFIFASHLILTGIGLYYSKTKLLKGVGVIMVPISLMIWYWFVPLI
jgi:hypothetical protein